MNFEQELCPYFFRIILTYILSIVRHLTWYCPVKALTQKIWMIRGKCTCPFHDCFQIFFLTSQLSWKFLEILLAFGPLSLIARLADSAHMYDLSLFTFLVSWRFTRRPWTSTASYTHGSFFHRVDSPWCAKNSSLAPSACANGYCAIDKLSCP